MNRWSGLVGLTLTVLVGGAVSGCRVQASMYVGHPHHVRLVTIEQAHVHTEACGHYWHEGHWYHWDGHHHGVGCGHVLVSGRWEVDAHARAN